MLRKLSLVIVFALALGSPAWAQSGDHDARLRLFRSVQKQILTYPQFSIFDSVDARVSETGEVELTGKVTMPYKRDALERRIAKAPGVVRVENKLEVMPVSQFDDDLRFRIARAIYSNANFWAYGSMANPPIHVIVDRGRVTLQGVVNNDVDRTLARAIASSFMSFGEVKNELRTDSEVKDLLEKL